MFLKLGLILAVATGVLAVLGTTALGTPVSGVTAVTARGDLDPLRVYTRFDNRARVNIRTFGAVELVTQRIEIAPLGSTGWHFHPGENVNVVQEGTLTLYHDEHCTVGVPYGPGTAFATHPDEVHLARNESTTETVVLFATYFQPKTTPPTAIRIDAPSPGPGCPE